MPDPPILGDKKRGLIRVLMNGVSLSYYLSEITIFLYKKKFKSFNEINFFLSSVEVLAN